MSTVSGAPPTDRINLNLTDTQKQKRQEAQSAWGQFGTLIGGDAKIQKDIQLLNTAKTPDEQKTAMTSFMADMTPEEKQKFDDAQKKQGDWINSLSDQQKKDDAANQKPDSQAGGSKQPPNTYGAEAADWAHKQSQDDPKSLSSSSVVVARTDSEANYHADALAYAKEDIKNMGGTDGTLTKAQMETAFGGPQNASVSDKMFTVMDTNKDGKVDASEDQAYIELQDDPSIMKGTSKTADSILNGLPSKRDGVTTADERSATDNLLLSDPDTASQALIQLKERASSAA
jgi:hypothetical protein